MSETWQGTRVRYADSSFGRSKDAVSACIMLMVPDRIARRLTYRHGKPDDPHHVTLCYLPDITIEDAGMIEAAVVEAVKVHPPLAGTVGGIGLFPASESSREAVLWLPVDVPGLAELRCRIADNLREMGLTMADDHGFCPHVTLNYLEQGERPRFRPSRSIPISFNEVTVAIGPEVVRHKLEGLSFERSKDAGTKGS